ncbi:MAG: zinc finger domain-containing protein [Candidatus Freyarchaeota archaeon]|nr:zinc finger domain-containing protein [Candidatus Freyarchaeota archaeon]MDO8091784.1 zinc finger domain-containing protein [Candidatus Sigynarchaeota archaeon]
MSEIKPQLCASCGKIISPEKGAVKFSCPNCNKYTFWRCERCRVFSNTYKCPVCNFEGP